MTPRHLIMAGALLIAAWLAIFGDKTPSGEIAEAVTREAPASAIANTPRPVAAAPGGDRGRRDTTLLVLQPRDQLIGGARAETRADALFASRSWTPPPPPPPPPAPEPPPSAPPLPFTYFGKKFENGKWEVYLARGAQTYVVHEHSTIEGIYQVQSIEPPLLSLIYLPLKQVQTISIGGID